MVESFLSVCFVSFAFFVLHDANEGSVISLVSAFLFLMFLNLGKTCTNI